MTLPSKVYRIISIFLLSAAGLDAALLDWEAHESQWVPVSMSGDFFDPGVTTYTHTLTNVATNIAGGQIDAYVTVTRHDGGSGSYPNFQGVYPDINTQPIVSGESTLQLSVQEFQSPLNYVSIEIRFSDYVRNVSFSIQDVDIYQTGNPEWVDQIQNVYSKAGTSGSEVAPTSVSFNSSYIEAVSSTEWAGIDATSNNPYNASEGDLTFNFGDDWANIFYFEYTPGADTTNFFSLQTVSVSDITFSIIPEVGASMGLFVFLGFFVSRRHPRIQSST